MDKESTLAKERDEELADTLMAISIVAKRLATKLRIITEKGENQSEE